MFTQRPLDGRASLAQSRCRWRCRGSAQECRCSSCISSWDVELEARDAVRHSGFSGTVPGVSKMLQELGRFGDRRAEPNGIDEDVESAISSLGQKQERTFPGRHTGRERGHVAILPGGVVPLLCHFFSVESCHRLSVDFKTCQ